MLGLELMILGLYHLLLLNRHVVGHGYKAALRVDATRMSVIFFSNSRRHVPRFTYIRIYNRACINYTLFNISDRCCMQKNVDLKVLNQQRKSVNLDNTTTN
jgi:hypothetical protein